MAAARPRIMKPRSIYFICTSPRSGSSVISDCLEQTDVAGRPREFFQPYMMAALHDELARGTPAADCQVLSMIRNAGSTPNGVFAAKVHWLQLECARKAFGQVGDVGAFTDEFPDARHIWLVRRDRVRQAMSYFRAVRSNEFYDFTGDRGDDSADDAACDWVAIERLIELFTHAETLWREYFERRGIEPLVLTYEDVAGDVPAVIPQVLEFLGIEAPPSTSRIAPRLHRQSNARIDAWIREFAAFRQARGLAMP